jgi:hypothetical protein
MPSIEKDDVEMSYRRGFEHGAPKTFRAVQQYLDPAAREVVRAWIEQESFCCARTDSGHVAAPPSSVKNSRRFT